MTWQDRLGPGDNRFQLTARLRRPGDYRQIFAASFRSVDSCFTVLSRRNGMQQARLGLAISKKCATRAVDRNRLKRIVRESFRHHQTDLEGIDCVVLCRHQAAAATNRRLFSSLAKHWKRVRNQSCATCSSP